MCFFPKTTPIFSPSSPFATYTPEIVTDCLLYARSVADILGSTLNSYIYTYVHLFLTRNKVVGLEKKKKTRVGWDSSVREKISSELYSSSLLLHTVQDAGHHTYTRTSSAPKVLQQPKPLFLLTHQFPGTCELLWSHKSQKVGLGVSGLFTRLH